MPKGCPAVSSGAHASFSVHTGHGAHPWAPQRMTTSRRSSQACNPLRMVPAERSCFPSEHGASSKPCRGCQHPNLCLPLLVPWVREPAGLRRSVSPWTVG